MACDENRNQQNHAHSELRRVSTESAACFCARVFLAQDFFRQRLEFSVTQFWLALRVRHVAVFFKREFTPELFKTKISLAIRKLLFYLR